MGTYKAKETQARRAIEVHDANVLFGTNCPNIDLVVFGKTKAFYIQVKSSEKPAGKDSVVIDGSAWNDAQLYEDAPVFNKHDHFQASLVVIVDRLKNGETDFYIAPPAALESLVRKRSLEFARKLKRDGTPRSIKFRKELPRELLQRRRNAWDSLSETPLRSS
jgi:hypothetical protein